MDRQCHVCGGPASGEGCFARLEEGEHPLCRACWEKVLLDPRRVLRQLEGQPLDRTPPPFPVLRA